MNLKRLLPTVQARAASHLRYAPLLFGLCIATVGAASDLTIHLEGNASLSHKKVQYTCDAGGSKIGAPSGAFTVEYINGGGNSLVVVPISGSSLIFSNVMAASGARYVAQQYTWWDAHGAATLYSDSMAGKAQSVCTPVTGK